MRVRFYAVAGKQREADTAKAFGEGVRLAGDEFEIVDGGKYIDPDPEVDVACIFALKGRRIMDGYRRVGARVLMFDKGLVRAGSGLGGPRGYLRISIDEFMCINLMMREKRSPRRWIETGIEPRKYREKPADAPIIFAGSSQKYCNFHGLGDSTEYAAETIRLIRKLGLGRPIIYRPKPSWPGAVPIPNTEFSRPPQTISDVLSSAYALVTHGSHAGIDAIVAGVPAIVLGPGAARPVAGTELQHLRAPGFPSRNERAEWLAAIAWWQWRADEMSSGQCWRFIRGELEK